MTKQGTAVAVRPEVEAPGLWAWFDAPDLARWFETCVRSSVASTWRLASNRCASSKS